LILLQVFDYDFGLQDDFMGSARLPLEALEQNRYLWLYRSLRLMC